MKMKPYLQGLGAAALLAVCVPIVVNGQRGARDLWHRYRAYTEPVRVESVRRYHDGKVLDLNRLQVNWRTNNRCRAINYGNTEGYLLFDNIKRVLDRYKSDDVFKQGFDINGSIFNMNRDTTFMDWDLERPFVRESAETPEMLTTLGYDILTNACNDTEQKATSK